MGLDNGIIVRGKTELGKAYLAENWQDNYEDSLKGYEFTYLRKYWGIRNEIIHSLELSDEGGEYEISIEDVETIIQIFEESLNRKVYEQRDNFWEYHVGVRNLAEDIYRLTRLLQDIEYGNIDRNDIEIIFYDSY